MLGAIMPHGPDLSHVADEIREVRERLRELIRRAAELKERLAHPPASAPDDEPSETPQPVQ
jgi:hypothetical protein